MSLRLVVVDVPDDVKAVAKLALADAGASESWESPGGAFGVQIHAVLGAGLTGTALDLLHDRLEPQCGFRALVLPLDAVLPRPAASADTAGRQQRATAASVSREEIYASISGGAQLNAAFAAMTVLATVVAAIGLTRDNTAAVIGAMVVAPLLGPNMALALGLTLGDGMLVRASLRTAGVGVALAFATAFVLGFGLGVDPAIPELQLRTEVGFSDMLLAVAAGAAGTLAYGTGAPTYLVGVMVAVALLPPTVASGLFLGGGYVHQASGALLLVAVNAVAVVFSAMITFLATGMRPRAWWEKERASASARRAAAVLGILLAALLGLVWFSTSLATR